MLFMNTMVVKESTPLLFPASGRRVSQNIPPQGAVDDFNMDGPTRRRNGQSQLNNVSASSVTNASFLPYYFMNNIFPTFLPTYLLTILIYIYTPSLHLFDCKRYKRILEFIQMITLAILRRELIIMILI